MKRDRTKSGVDRPEDILDINPFKRQKRDTNSVNTQPILDLPLEDSSPNPISPPNPKKISKVITIVSNTLLSL